MLILTRHIDQVILIGPDITVTVLGVKGQQCRLGIDAPRDMPVDREELRIKKDAEKAIASAVRNGK